MRKLCALATLFAIITFAAAAVSEVPGEITYQGLLTDTTGVPINDVLSMTFTIYDDSTGGVSLWSESKTVEVTSGYFTTRLGSVNPVDVVYFDGGWRWLEIIVEQEIITPRSRLTTSPYAFRPGTVDGATGGTITGALTLQGTSVKNFASDQRGAFTFDPDGAPNDGALVGLINNSGVTTVQLQASEVSSQGPGGAIKLYDESGNLTIHVDGEKPGGGGDISLYNLSGSRTMRINGLTEDATLGSQIGMMEADGTKTIEITAEDSRAGFGPHIYLWEAYNDTAVVIASEGFNGNARGGKIRLFDGQNVATVDIEAASWDGSESYMIMRNPSGDPRLSLSSKGTMRLYNGTGDITVSMFGDYSSSGFGRVVTSVLEITGGSDLSEQFDVRPGHSLDRPEPGMVVVIDPDHPGQLITSSKAYDPTVAGIISGAGDVNPGMLMGHRGTAADGQHPVALTGRVYCLADASYGAIKPGDFLTSSDTPGHAMKVADRDRAYGAVIGKAMTGLDQGRGLILVLVNLQ